MNVMSAFAGSSPSASSAPLMHGAGTGGVAGTPASARWPRLALGSLPQPEMQPSTTAPLNAPRSMLASGTYGVQHCAPPPAVYAECAPACPHTGIKRHRHGSDVTILPAACAGDSSRLSSAAVTPRDALDASGGESSEDDGGCVDVRAAKRLMTAMHMSGEDGDPAAMAAFISTAAPIAPPAYAWSHSSPSASAAASAAAVPSPTVYTSPSLVLGPSARLQMPAFGDTFGHTAYASGMSPISIPITSRLAVTPSALDAAVQPPPVMPSAPHAVAAVVAPPNSPIMSDDEGDSEGAVASFAHRAHAGEEDSDASVDADAGDAHGPSVRFLVPSARALLRQAAATRLLKSSIVPASSTNSLALIPYAPLPVMPVLPTEQALASAGHTAFMDGMETDALPLTPGGATLAASPRSDSGMETDA